MPGRPVADRFRLTAGRIAVLAAIAAAWEAGARIGVIDPYFVSGPTKLALTVGGWFEGGFI